MSVDKSGDRVRQMFGEIAGRYDFLNHLLSFSMDRYWRWRAIRKAPPQGGLPILISVPVPGIWHSVTVAVPMRKLW